jgi:LytR cell envelope-related transcriptional attenuator
MAQMDVERPRRTSPARGVALIATAVIIGLFVLRNGFETTGGDGPSPQVEASDTTDTTAADGGGEAPTETTAPPAPRAPAEVTVLVANTTDVSGAAGGLTDNLVGKGYQAAPPTDGQPALEQTQVLFVEGFEAEAQAVAATVGAPAEAVQPMPATPPVGDLAGAQVLVMLGSDLAAA